MRCMYCSCTESKVIDSRSADDDTTIRRRRECMGCGRRFTTYETIEIAPILVEIGRKPSGVRRGQDQARDHKIVRKTARSARKNRRARR